MRSLCLVLLLAPCAVWAQVSVTGTVSDSTGLPLPGATVVLMQPADSVLVSFASSRADGAFEVRRVREGAYILKVSFVGYQSATQDIEVGGDALDVGSLVLQEAVDELGKLVVDGERVPIVLRGDTLDYDAAAFGTRQGASVEDLLRQLPGMEVEEDGSVTAQGQKVQRVLVDGKEFFGDDPTVATRNLPADAVERVQVYDKSSDTAEFTGVEDGEEERTINLELKEDRKSGYFGNVGGGLGGVPSSNASGAGLPSASGASGPGMLYDAQASVNRFSPSTQISFIGNVNNINRQSFSVGDYFQFMGGMSMMANGGTFRVGGGGIPVGEDLGDGFSDTASGGINFNREFSPKTSIRTSYFLHNLDKTRQRSIQRQQFFGEDLSSRLEETADGDDGTQIHRLNLFGEHKISDGHDIRLRSSLRYGTNGARTFTEQQTFNTADLLENTSDTDIDTDGSNAGGDAALTYRRKFGRRSLVAELNADLNQTDADADFLATNRFYASGDLLTTEEINQLQSQRGDTFTAGGSLLFTQPLAPKQALQARVEHRETREDQTREVFDILGDVRTLNAAQSSAFERTYLYDKVGVTYVRNTEPVSLSAGLTAQLTRLDGTQRGADQNIDQQYLRLLPEATVSYAFSQSRNVELRYETSTREPSVRELQPVVDITDPLRIYVGNPDLRPAYTHSLNARYLTFDQFTSTNFFGFVRGSYSPTAISTSRTVDAQFRQTSTPINTSGTWSVIGNGSFGTVYKPIKSRVSLSANTLFNRAVEIINGDENASSLFRGTLNATVQNRNKERFDLSIGPKITYNNAAYSLNPQLDRSYVNWGLSAGLGWTPSDAFEISTDFDLDVYGNAVAGGSASTQAVPLWRASAAYTIMQGRGRIELVATDLLDRNLGVTYNNTASYLEEERVSSLGRYVLLRFVYDLAGSGGGPGRPGIRIMG
ncbi:TonB-dependent receptor [Rubricoccus marinus]|uniref:Outer membrane protein beta-barrel domain-containing protein n=1 Tax=Rubricoccus marinus TaxID=716817 RepID=A0A259U045_9BACT|nr:TonB-dependent receptor [Rubricoccus marinus]OZC03372.1 hypothetical protein BSZ36_10505 [Rubricoccus marinus]